MLPISATFQTTCIHLFTLNTILNILKPAQMAYYKKNYVHFTSLDNISAILEAILSHGYVIYIYWIPSILSFQTIPDHGLCQKDLVFIFSCYRRCYLRFHIFWALGYIGNQLWALAANDLSQRIWVQNCCLSVKNMYFSINKLKLGQTVIWQTTI